MELEDILLYQVLASPFNEKRKYFSDKVGAFLGIIRKQITQSREFIHVFYNTFTTSTTKSFFSTNDMYDKSREKS